MSQARNLGKLNPSNTGQLPNKVMASGSVLQVKRASNGSSPFTTTSQSFATVATLNITPLYSTSTFIATFSGALYKKNNITGNEGSSYYTFTLNGIQVPDGTDGYYGYYNESASSFTIIPLSRTISFQTNGISQQVIEFKLRSVGAGVLTFLYTFAELIVMEIAP